MEANTKTVNSALITLSYRCGNAKFIAETLETNQTRSFAELTGKGLNALRLVVGFNAPSRNIMHVQLYLNHTSDHAPQNITSHCEAMVSAELKRLDIEIELMDVSIDATL